MTAPHEQGPAPHGAGPWVRLDRYVPDAGDHDDGFRDFREEVADYTRLDPLETLRGLQAASGIPVGALARYVLARWASGGNEAILELGVSGVDHLARTIASAEEAGTDAARLEAYERIRAQVAWLRAGAVSDD